ncbi:MAG: hypothetical protein JW774_09175 [Candidatus Aureabacteria bacterium]|nr:hypothetical protein [Candidatus Auribacterota bacterium]
MRAERKLFINDRVKAAFSLFFIMALSVLVVFLGIEELKQLPTLSQEQRLFLQKLEYPVFFKIANLLCWGFISTFFAYLFLFYRYQGFFLRLSHFFEKVSRKEKGQIFHFREHDRFQTIHDSLENLLSHYRGRLKASEEELTRLKEKLFEMYFRK